MTIRIGILGTGYAAEIHSKALKAVAPHATRWYASRDKARAAAMASRFGGAGVFGSYDEAIASADLDAVIIALPPSLHRQWALLGLAAGKHVVVEKPPFLTVADLDMVDAAARQANRQVLVAENYFYKPLTAALRAAIARSDIGRVRLIQLNALKGQQTTGWRNEAGLAGGGALFEGGIHWVSLLANIGLTPTRIRAAFSLPASQTGSTGGPGKLERTAVATIEYAEGAVATLSYSWELPATLNGLRMSRVYGTEGVLKFETNGIFAATMGRRWSVEIPGLIDLAGYRAMMKDFVAAIEANRPPAYTLALARRDLELIEAAYASTTGAQYS